MVYKDCARMRKIRAKEQRLVGTFRCGHCGKRVSNDYGADDAIERYVGPICDSCSSRLPPHVHDAAEEWYAKNPDK